MTEVRPPSTPPGQFFLTPCLSFPILQWPFSKLRCPSHLSHWMDSGKGPTFPAVAKVSSRSPVAWGPARGH